MPSLGSFTLLASFVVCAYAIAASVAGAVRLREEVGRRIVGQQQVLDELLMAILAGGHALLVGAPGLAKTTAIKELAARIEADFHRVQFTPDLLPADLTGTEIYRPQTTSFEFQRGPIFHNLILADEVNRAPAKVQSALLEAMGERQVTVGRDTYALPALFRLDLKRVAGVPQILLYTATDGDKGRSDHPPHDEEQEICQVSK